MKIILELDTDRPQAAVLEIREAVGIFTFKVNSDPAIPWDAKQKFGSASTTLSYIDGLQAEPREPARAPA